VTDCDLISAEGYAEQQRGSLTLRVAAVTPPAHPLGQEYAEPHYAVFASATDNDIGWLALFVPVTDVDAAIATIDADAEERASRLSILIGASWAAVAASARTVVEAQEEAVMRLPSEVYGYSLAELRAVRTYINTPDPNLTAVLLGMTYHWQTDPGGTHGPRFSS